MLYKTFLIQKKIFFCWMG